MSVRLIRIGLTVMSFMVAGCLLIFGLMARGYAPGAALTILVTGACLMAAAAYSVVVTKWWAEDVQPRLPAHHRILAHIAPVVGLLSGGALLIAAALIVWFGWKLASVARAG